MFWQILLILSSALLVEPIVEPKPVLKPKPALKL